MESHEQTQEPRRVRGGPRLPALSQGLLLAAVLLLAAGLRFTGLNWDEGQWIHPDEGHMRIVTAMIAMPDRLSLYFDTARSPLNSFNQGQPYSYGTLPLFLVRWTAEWLDRGCGEPAEPGAAAAGLLLLGPGAEPCRTGTFTRALSTLVGRFYSALADVGTVLLAYLIGRRLFGPAAGLLAAGLYALTAFAIQQAHFFTVDSLAAFFMTLAVYFSMRSALADTRGGLPWGNLAAAGVATGLAVACKLSAAFVTLFVALGGLAWWVRALPFGPPPRQLARLVPLGLSLALAALLSLVAFRLAQPYAFQGPSFLGVQPNHEWWDRMSQIQSEQTGRLDSPPGQQWTNRPPILYPWVNMVVWGMGLPLGLAGWAGWVLAGIDWMRGRRGAVWVVWLGVTFLFLYQATRWVKTMRYFLPLYPLLAVLAAYALLRLCATASPGRRGAGCAVAVAVVVGAALWGGAMTGIYLRPHTRVAASRWIYRHISPASTVANEHWDWGLPLPLDGHNPFGGLYEGIEMANYDEDTPEKRDRLYRWLDEADYIFLASNRLYASMARLPTRYPLTNAYYRALFAGKLGFELVGDFTSYPAIGPFVFPDQEMPYPLIPPDTVTQPQPVKVQLPPAEEAFSVYDHPRVLVFRKAVGYSRARVEAVLGAVDLAQAQPRLKPIEATRPLYRHGNAWLLGALGILVLTGLAVRAVPPPTPAAQTS